MKSCLGRSLLAALVCLFCVLNLSLGQAQTTVVKATIANAKTITFKNPIFEGADPWVVKDPNHDRFIWCRSGTLVPDSIELGISDSITSVGQLHTIWKAPATGPYSKEVWAPELHFLDGRWYVYFAADDGDNHHHLTYVLESESADPLGPYQLHGPLKTGDGPQADTPNIWAIDMTVLQHGKERYAIWSGWDAPGTDQQYLYIARMKSPTELSGPRVQICDNDDYLWERTEEKLESRGLAEGPEVLQYKDRTFVSYSTGASWLPTYKLGLLELVGSDPMNPASWKKFAEPSFQSTETVYGVGHSCFVQLVDQTPEWWHVFHAKLDRSPGWHRGVFVQPFTFSDSGMPQFGKPLDRDVIQTMTPAPAERPSH